MDLIQTLTRRSHEIGRILARRDTYVDMIDWSAMTERDRDNALTWIPYELYMEEWHIDEKLAELIPWTWDDG